MTMQEAYDRMRAFYSRPDTMLGRYRGGCEYISKGDELARCAVGTVLPVELLMERGEELNLLGGLPNVKRSFDNGNHNAEEMFQALGLTDGGTFNVELYEFLREAQELHDRDDVYPYKDDVITGLDELARSWGLKVAA